MCWRAGETMPSLEKRFPVTRQAIAKRCKKEGWVQSEQAPMIAATATTARYANPVTGPDHRVVNSGNRSPAIQQRILDMISTGSTLRMAAQRVGISYDNLHAWRVADPRFEAAIKAAEGDLAAGLVRQIAEAGQRGDWRAAAHLLERHPLTRDEFAPRPPAASIGPAVVLNLHLRPEYAAILSQASAQNPVIEHSESEDSDYGG